MKIKKRVVFIFVMIFSFLFLGCAPADKGESEAEIQEEADKIVNAVSQDLADKNPTNTSFNLNPEQLAAIKSSQSTETRNANLKSSEETGKASAAIVKGTLIALGHYSNKDLGGATSDTKQSSKVEIVKVVNQKIMDILNGNPGSQTFSDSMKLVFSNIVSYFDSSGITQTNLIAAVGELAVSALTHAKTLGMSADVVIALGVELLKSGVGNLGLNGAGLLDKLVPEATEKLTTSIVVGMKEGGAGNDAIVEKIPDIINAAVVALGDVPKLDPEDLGASVKAVEKGLKQGLAQIGLENSQINDQETVVKNALTDALKKLADKDTTISLSDKKLVISVEGAKELVDYIAEKLFSIDSTTGLQLSEDQVKTIKDGIQAKVDVTTDYKLESIIPLVFAEAEASIDKLSPPLSSDREKIDVLKTVVEAVVAFLSGKVADEEFGDKNLSDALEIVSENSINPLLKDMTGDPGVFQEMAKSLIGPLEMVPMGKTSMADAARVAVEGIVSNIDEIGMSESDQSAALSAALNGAIKAAQKGKVTMEQIKEAEAKIAAGAAESLVENQKADLEKYLKADDASSDASADKILKDIADKTLEAMKEAGATDVPALADDIVEGVFDALKKDDDPNTEDLDVKQVSEALDKTAEAVKESLEEIAKADDGEISDKEQEEINKAVKDMSEKIDKLIAELTPFGTPGIDLSATEISTMEDATQGMVVGVALDLQPGNNVVVTIKSQNTEQGTVDPSTLPFTPENWFEAQEVKITGAPNKIREGNVKYAVTFTTDSGARKTVLVTDMDDDVPGLDITPFGSKVYRSAYSPAATFLVRLKTQPFGTVKVTWAMETGKEEENIGGNDGVSILPLDADCGGRTLTFMANSDDWKNGKTLCLKPVAYEFLKNLPVSVSVSALVIQADHAKDVEYTTLDTLTILMTILKTLKMKELSLTAVDIGAASAEAKLTFKDDLFADEDMNVIYQKALQDQTFDVKFATYQQRPRCISTDVKVDFSDCGAQKKFNFTIRFINTPNTAAQAVVDNWAKGYKDGSTVCTGSDPGVVSCTYTSICYGTGDTDSPVDGENLTLSAENTIFSSEGVGNDSAACSAKLVDGGSNLPASAPDNPSNTVGARITFKFDSILDASKAKFVTIPNQTTIGSGLWVLDSWSPVLIDQTKDVEPYGPDRCLYLHIP